MSVSRLAPIKDKTVRKTFWCVVGVLAATACLAGCNGRDDVVPSAAAGAPVAAQKNLVTATWRPADKTAEFLSAWRARE